jgi:hypothetical protein
MLGAFVSEIGFEATGKYEHRKTKVLAPPKPFLFQSTVPAG